MDESDDDDDDDDDDDGHAARRPALPTPEPELRPAPRVPGTAALSADVAMHLAADWYNNAGPYGHLYKMSPMAASAVAGGDRLWSVRFRVAPDTGFVYVRNFTFDTEGEGDTWQAVAWAEDPAQPDREYTLDEARAAAAGHGDATAAGAGRDTTGDSGGGDGDGDDDDETIEEEERIMRATRESSANELKELHDVGCPLRPARVPLQCKWCALP